MMNQFEKTPFAHTHVCELAAAAPRHHDNERKYFFPIIIRFRQPATTTHATHARALRLLAHGLQSILETLSLAWRFL